MTVGLVIVSHSAKIAEGIVELAAQMAQDVRLIAAGGTDDGRIGTSFDRVSAAIAEADDGGGVVVLCDLGSAVLTAETALDFLDDAQRDRVRIADAPIVEGSVAAAVSAATGDDLEAVLAAALSAAAQASGGSPAEGAAASASEGPAGDHGAVSATATLRNRSGLHARPAAEFVKLASTFSASVTVNEVDAKSLLRIMSLGLPQGSEVRIKADGEDADTAVRALVELVESGFGEE